MTDYNKIIESTKVAIKRNNLIVPSNRETEIVQLVTSLLQKNKEYSIPSLKSSTLDIEMAKVPIELKAHFHDKILLKRYKNEVLFHKLICQHNSQRYSTTFIGEQMPVKMDIPYELDELSHIYIGHEVIHILTMRKNYEEWAYKFLYSEVLPIFYEFIQGENKSQLIRRYIINERLDTLLKMYKQAFDEDVITELHDNPDKLKCYQMPYNQYFISFYYTILLYLHYLDNPQQILKEIKEVLHQRITTKNLLERLNLLNGIDESSFTKGYNLL